MKYYLYHIPGKKIGVTCDIYNRVTEQQGYEDHEFEILEMSEDIDYISDREIELQKQHGYRVDMIPYKNLKPKTNIMNINVTEQTTTFPYPIDRLKGNDLFGNDVNLGSRIEGIAPQDGIAISELFFNEIEKIHRAAVGQAHRPACNQSTRAA